MSLPEFSDHVVRWQAAHGRTGLPWQGTRDPYRVWLSEVMLQQTTVAAVRSYFERFTQRWPTVADLAAARDEDVMAAAQALARSRPRFRSRAQWLAEMEQLMGYRA